MASVRRRDRMADDTSRVFAFVAGLFVGAWFSVTMVWLLASLAEPIPIGLRAIGLGFLLLLFGGVDVGLWHLPLPDPARQVPDSVFRRGRLLGPFQFGIEMGTGVRTYVTAAVPFVLVATLILLSAGYLQCLLVAIGFAAGRASVPLDRLRAKNRNAWSDRLDRSADGLKKLCAVGGGALAVSLLADSFI